MDPELRGALNQVVVDLRGEIRSGDAETRAALNQLAVDLRGEIRSVDVDFRGALSQLAVDLCGEIQTSSTGLFHQVSEQIRESELRMRRHFDVVGESLRSDIGVIAEGLAASREQAERRIDEQAGRTGGLEGRVVRLEVRVTDLEGDRKPRRPRRRQ